MTDHFYGHLIWYNEKRVVLMIDMPGLPKQFIFTSPTFTTDKAEKSKREFYIPRLNRERSLYGT